MMKLIFEGTHNTIKKEMIQWLKEVNNDMVSSKYLVLFEKCTNRDSVTVKEVKEYCKENYIDYKVMREEILSHTTVGAVPELKEDGTWTSVRRFKNIKFK